MGESVAVRQRATAAAWASLVARLAARAHHQAHFTAAGPPPPSASLRLAGDLGEAFKAQLSRRLYLGSYAVVALYGVLDAADKGAKAAARNAQPAPCAPPHGAGAALPLPAAAAACAGRLAAAAAARLPAPPAHLYTANSANEAASIPVAVPVAAAVLDTALW